MKEIEAKADAQQMRSMEDVKEMIKKNQYDLTAM
jgi:hypothetical protein